MIMNPNVEQGEQVLPTELTDTAYRLISLMKDEVKKYLAGKKDTSEEEMREAISKTSSLVATMMTAILVSCYPPKYASGLLKTIEKNLDFSYKQKEKFL